MKRPKDRPTYRILRYSIQMQMKEVGTKYWVKLWWWKEGQTKRYRELVTSLSEPQERLALFNSQEISRGLSISYKFGAGTRLEGEIDRTEANNQLNRQRSDNPGQKSDRVVDATGPSIQPRSPIVEHILSQLSNIESEQSQSSPSPRAPRALVAPMLSMTAQNALSDLQKKRTTSTPDPLADMSPSPSQSSLKFIRPTKRQSTENCVEYSVGAPRNSGGKSR
jgi:hypothetical protein